MEKKHELRRDDLIFPELSFQIIGCAYEVFNELVPGHLEKVYQRSMAMVYSEKNIPYAEQVQYNVKFKDKIVDKGFLDFLVHEKIIVELKKDEFFSKAHIEQVLNYLQLSGLQSVIIINFTKTGVKFRRIVNTFNS